MGCYYRILISENFLLLVYLLNVRKYFMYRLIVVIDSYFLRWYIFVFVFLYIIIIFLLLINGSVLFLIDIIIKIRVLIKRMYF